MSVPHDCKTSLAGLRILIVEDDAWVGMQLEDLLTDQGAEAVGLVPTVRAGLAALAVELPDVVVLDVDLRGERSTPVAAALQAAKVPFVLSTGYGRKQLDEPELREAPIVPKPIIPLDLIRILAETLATARRPVAGA